MKSRRTLAPEDSKKMVVTSNDLIHAKYSFTLWQKRVFTYMVSEINSFDDREFPIQKMYIRDLMDFFKVKNKDDYNVIQRIPEQMYDMSMKMAYRTEKGHKRWREVRILSQFTRPEDKEEDNAYIELKFNDDLKPHLLELKRLFSQYDIRNIIHLRSVYSFKIYELLKANEYLNKWEVSLDDLKELLDVEDKYKHYGSFKLKVLNQAQKDLNECCDVTFTYDERTVGKRVDRLIFYVQKNQPTRGIKPALKEAKEAKDAKNTQPEPIVIPIPIVEPQRTPDGEGRREAANPQVLDHFFSNYFDQVKPYGVSASTLAKWIETYPPAHIEACIREFLEKIQKGKLRVTEAHQQGGYLRTLIEKADFTSKEVQQQAKIEVKKQEDIRIQQAQAIAQQSRNKAIMDYQRDEAVMWQIFEEQPEVETDIFTDIARREGTHYTAADYSKLPFLTSKVLILVKRRFPERFNA